MQGLVVHLRQWLDRRGGRRKSPSPVEVRCSCGQVVSGQRRTVHQVLPCPGCGRKLFLFPHSPLPPVSASGRGGKSFAALHLSSRPAWLWPVLAAGLTLAVVVAVFAAVLSRLSSHPASEKDALSAHVTAGKKALAEGNFHLAAEDLKAACDLRDQHPDLLPGTPGRELTRLYRQAALLDDLLSESLGEIVLKAADEPEAEWQADFARRYQGRAVVFEGWMRWDVATGTFELEYPILAGRERVRLDWSDLKLLKRLPPADQPQRVLFGARLAAVRRDRQGGWVLRFDPDSGVFLTSPGAAACCPRPLDAGLRAVLDQQARWDEAGP